MRSLILASVAVASVSFALAGCAAQVGSADVATESTESLSQFGIKLIGDYHYDASSKFYDTLSLASSSYTATNRPCAADADCATEVESGTWSARAATNTLTLHPYGSDRKRFHLSVAGDGSGMKISDGIDTEVLVRDVVAPVDCATDADCATGEACRFVSNCPPAPPGGVTCMSGHNACMKVAAEGESCGFRTQSTPCSAGLDCVWVAGTPLDALTCVRHSAQYGESCGGNMTTAAQCASGLVCTHLNSDGTFRGHPDTSGVCRVDVDGTCGGYSANAQECAYPMLCNSSSPDLPGTCAR